MCRVFPVCGEYTAYNNRRMIPMAKLKIGFIGCGGIANQKHLPAMKANSDLCPVCPSRPSTLICAPSAT